MTDLQCPARFLVRVIDRHTASSLGTERVAAVYDGTSSRAGRDVAARLGVPATETSCRVAVEAVLAREPEVMALLSDLADLHRGESVLISAEGLPGAQVEVNVDADGVRLRESSQQTRSEPPPRRP